jgi:transposase
MSALTKVIPCLKYVHLDDIESDGATTIIVGSAKHPSARCPLCGQHSRSVHSWYVRSVADLPLAGAAVILRLRVRRFFCRVPTCPRRIFCERLPDLVAPQGRWSRGLRAAVQQIGLALGGEAGARLAQVLGMRASPDSVLNLIRAAPLPAVGPVQRVGVDEWAWRKGRRFGTILVDLDRHCVVALLPERSAAATAAWLAHHPEITVITRDRSSLYADAATRGAPQAIQVVDRFHLMRNLSEAIETFLRTKSACLAQAAGALTRSSTGMNEASSTPTDRDRPLPPWRQRHENVSSAYQTQRVSRYEAIKAWRAQGMDIADIARTVGVSRQTVYTYLRMERPPERRRRRGGRRDRCLDPYEDYLRRRWSDGCHNGLQLWRELRALGFAYSSSPVSRLVAQWRHDPALQPARRSRSTWTDARGPSAREVARLFVRRPERRTSEQEAYLQHLLPQNTHLATAYALTQDFATMLRTRHGQHLDAWIDRATRSGIDDLARFAHGLGSDEAAIQAGLTRVESNGQTEGHVTRLKLVRRTMYGRGRLDLLKRRVLCAA